MGLDQEAWLLFTNNDGKMIKKSITCWRKHNRLEGWMRNLWYKKGNYGQFNCCELELTEDDLIALQSSIEQMKLPLTLGFFFGSDSYDKWPEKEYSNRERDEFFVSAALKYIRELKARVYYSSSW